jgi:uncharacterized membrane protein
MRDSQKLMATAVGIGAIAGLRSLTAPALVTWATNQHWIALPSRRLRFLKRNSAASIASALAIGELIADKLPFTPDRTSPPALAARILAGSLSAGALCASRDTDRKLIAAGTILGGLAAVAGAFVGMNARRRLRESLNVSDRSIAIAEDAVAIGGGLLLVRSAA